MNGPSRLFDVGFYVLMTAMVFGTILTVAIHNLLPVAVTLTALFAFLAGGVLEDS